MTPGPMIGLDVGKRWLDVAVGSTGTPRRFANTLDGHHEMQGWLQDHQPRLVILEASGGYERGIVTVLDAAGVAVSIRNPTQIRRFAQSLGKRAKTDRLDAQLLARYGEQTQPDPTPVPSGAARTIAALFTRRQQVIGLRTQEQNRRHQADPVVIASIDAVLETLNLQVKKLETEITKRMRHLPQAWAMVRRLMTAPGIKVGQSQLAPPTA